MTAVQSVDVNCRGMQCPAPILQIAKAARGVAAKPAVLHIYADDCDFPADLEAWCRSAKAELRWAPQESDGAFHGVVALNGASLDAAESPTRASTTGSQKTPSAQWAWPRLRPRYKAASTAAASRHQSAGLASGAAACRA